MLADRFQTWYRYERDCNAKTLAMLHSVPAERRQEPTFQQAVDLMEHLLTARRFWLYRLGVTAAPPPTLFPQGTSLADLETMLQTTEAESQAYLDRLDDQELTRVVEYRSTEGKHLRWTVEGALTQLNGHAWYHRGQIALLVANLGGEVVDTDYVFWARPAPVETTA